MIAQSKERLAEQRESIYESHKRGLSAVQVCAKLTASADSAIQALWNDILGDLSETDSKTASDGCVLVAHGGYGRRQLAPHSDIDLMILHKESARPVAQQIAQRLAGDIFDLGLSFGHSLRTPDEAMQMVREDAVVATSLIESRHLIGSLPLYEAYFAKFSEAIQRRKGGDAVRFVSSRRDERRKYGETVYLLEPNIKRSRGGLRDIHLLRWLWFLQSGVSDLDRLRSLGLISKFDHHRLCTSRDFMLRVRNDLHFSSTKPTDALTRAEQLAIAERLGYQGTVGVKPVEQFMRDYFKHASHVWFLASRLSDLCTPRTTVERVLDPMMGRSVEKDYRLGLREISSTQSGRDKLTRHLSEVFHLVELARTHDRRIDQETWYTIYRAAPNYATDLKPETTKQFLELLHNPIRLGKLLRRLHELGVLEKAIPQIGHARFLLQFNQYHKYTVDAHCLRAVEEATRFAERNDLLGTVYRNLANKALFHLTLILHDLGKGKDEDHSIVGERIAREIGPRLHINEADTESMALLILHHLDMSHLAFRRNTSDPEVIEQFASWIKTPENLGMLFVLTCADMAAVGPGVLNDWKISVLAELYSRTKERLLQPKRTVTDRRSSMRVAVWQLLDEKERDSSQFKQRYSALPESFLVSRSPAAIVTTLRRLEKLEDNTADVWGGYQQDGLTLEMIAVISDGIGRGVFSSMAGALSAKGLHILAAETAVLDGNNLLLRFLAEDPIASEKINAAEANARAKSIAAAMATSYTSDEPPRFPTVWGADRQAEDAALTNQSTDIRVDIELSEECLIVEVFTIDRVGLLYELARAIHEMQLVIRFARIATELDQVVDVFYVSERDNTKPTGQDRIDQIKDRMREVIDG